MFQRRRSIGWILAVLFLAMQAFWLVHRLEHDLGKNDEAACEFCASIHGMGSTPTSSDAVAIVVPAPRLAPQGEFAVRRDAEPVQPRQQGPPLRS